VQLDGVIIATVNYLVDLSPLLMTLSFTRRPTIHRLLRGDTYTDTTYASPVETKYPLQDGEQALPEAETDGDYPDEQYGKLAFSFKIIAMIFFIRTDKDYLYLYDIVPGTAPTIDPANSNNSVGASLSATSTQSFSSSSSGVNVGAMLILAVFIIAFLGLVICCYYNCREAKTNALPQPSPNSHMATGHQTCPVASAPSNQTKEDIPVAVAVAEPPVVTADPIVIVGMAPDTSAPPSAPPL